MSDTGLTVPGMTEPPRRYDVTITVDQDGGHHPQPRRVRRGGPTGGIGQSGQHRQRPQAGQIVSTVTVLGLDQPAAVAIALAVVSETLKMSGRAVHPHFHRMAI